MTFQDVRKCVPWTVAKGRHHQVTTSSLRNKVSPKTFKKETWRPWKPLSSRPETGFSVAVQKLHGLSILVITTALHKFHHLAVHELVDIHAVLRLERRTGSLYAVLKCWKMQLEVVVSFWAIFFCSQFPSMSSEFFLLVQIVSWTVYIHSYAEQDWLHSKMECELISWRSSPMVG